MYLSKIEINNFRNYTKANIQLCNGINVFIGDNAQGKTNILESIYLLALTKSHRLGMESNIIKNGCDACRVYGFLRDDGKLKELEVKINNTKKTVYLNQKSVTKIASYISNMNVIMFSPTDLDIIKGSPQVRRNTLNIEISQLYPLYIDYLNQYNKILKTRNEYLKQMSINGISDPRFLEIINEKLVERAIKIYQYRKKFLDSINSKISQIYSNIAGFNGLRVDYENNLDISDFNDDNLRKVLLNKLKNSIKREVSQGMTLYGPHRDDFSFYIDDEDMKFYSSQGQQRLAIISFKLAEVEIFIEEKGTSPILLLDDIFSELDINKRNHLMKFIPDNTQTIIATTDLKNIKKNVIDRAKVFVVKNGNIKEKAELK